MVESEVNIPQRVESGVESGIEVGAGRIEEVARPNVTLARPRTRNGFSMHFPKRRNGRDESRFWNRPCFYGYNMVAIGDSLLRSFGRKRYLINGASINAFGGLDLFEFISLLRKGSLVSQIENPKYKRDLADGRVVIPVNEKCNRCNTTCMKDFNGKLLIAVGINNSLHAADLPNLVMNANNEYESIQDVEKIFRLIDETLTQE